MARAGTRSMRTPVEKGVVAIECTGTRRPLLESSGVSRKLRVRGVRYVAARNYIIYIACEPHHPEAGFCGNEPPHRPLPGGWWTTVGYHHPPHLRQPCGGGDLRAPQPPGDPADARV